MKSLCYMDFSLLVPLSGKTYIPVELRRQFYERAKGCCEYCLIPDVATFAPHEIDHIIAEKHGGRTENVSYC